MGEAAAGGVAISGERVREMRRFERSRERERERAPERERLCEKPSVARSRMVLELARGGGVRDRVDAPLTLR